MIRDALLLAIAVDGRGVRKVGEVVRINPIVNEPNAPFRNMKALQEMLPHRLADRDGEIARAGPKPPAEVGAEKTVPRRHVRDLQAARETIRHDLSNPRMRMEDVHRLLSQPRGKLPGGGEDAEAEFDAGVQRQTPVRQAQGVDPVFELTTI